jgi:hypothetical protein
MTKLTKAQTTLLSVAAAQESGWVEATDATKSVAPALIKRGLLISLPQEGGPSRLILTDAGRAAVGAAAAPAGDAIAGDVQSEAGEPGGAAPGGKLGAMVALLRTPQGATIEALVAATGWQAHSVRGAMSGALKKKHGMTILSDKTAAGRIYRIPAKAEA